MLAPDGETSPELWTFPGEISGPWGDYAFSASGVQHDYDVMTAIGEPMASSIGGFTFAAAWWETVDTPPAGPPFTHEVVASVLTLGEP